MVSKRRKVSAKKASQNVDVAPVDDIDGNAGALPQLPALPPELLSEIFAYTDAIYREEQGARIITPWTPVHQLYRVCKTWREIARNTPELWTTITIRGMRTMLRAEKWFEHSKKRPCSVWVKSNTGKFTSHVAFGLLEPHMDRIAKLELEVWNQRTDLLWPNVPSSIRFLSIAGTILMIDELLPLLSLNPRLERLAFSLYEEPSFGPRWTEYNIEPTRLTHLDMREVALMDVEDMLQLLRLCPNLKFFHIAEGETGSMAIPDSSAVELPELQAMSLQPWSLLSRLLLPLLITPSLQHLVFADLTCEEMEAAAFEGILGDSEKELLIDEDLRMHVGDVAFFFRHMPGLEDLVVDGFGLGGHEQFNVILGALTTPDQDGNFALPNLRRLTLRNGWSWFGSLSVLERRYEGVPDRDCHIPVPLESISVEGCEVSGGWNSLERLCRRHGTRFTLYDSERHYKRDRSFMSKAEIREWRECTPEYMQWDEEWNYGADEEEGNESGDESAGAENAASEQPVEARDSPEALFLQRWLTRGSG